MKLIITFRDDEARSLQYFLQRRYKSNAQLRKLAKMAIRTESGNEAKKELDCAKRSLD